MDDVSNGRHVESRGGAANPARRDGHYFDEITDIIARLRAPGGCPWDREQTLESLRKCIIEEAYELSEAITRGDMRDTLEEAGDLLLQVVFVAQIAGEKGLFDMKDVVRVISDKLIRRHPHVFGDAKADDPDAVLRNWEMIKTEERRDKKEDTSVLAGVPVTLPPLLRADRIQDKAAHIGFDWPKGDSSPVFAKLDEEIGELRNAAEAGDADNMEEELGDVLFMAVNLARYLKIDPNAALTSVCGKFESRFRLMEKFAAQEGRPMQSLTLDELNVLWDRAKVQLKNGN